MSKPSLHEVLNRHRPKSSQAEKPLARKMDGESPSHGHVKHTVLEAKAAKALFFDLPKEHKFWLADGKEINNLSELYRSLVEMSEEVFRHHVKGHKNDFAKWVEEILGDTVLARKLRSSSARIDQVDAVKERISRIRSQGRRIPRPFSNLNPDYSFIRVEKAVKMVPRPSMGLEHKFKIRGKGLTPDTSFIAGAHHNPNTDVISKYEEIIDSQRATIRALENEVSQRRFSEEDLKELIDNYKIVYQQVAEIQNHLADLGKDTARSGKNDEHQKKEIEGLRELVIRLREKEREILAEIKQVSRTEDKINARTGELLEKEKDIAKKEGLLLRKQGHFNNLRSQYDEKLKKTSEVRVPAVPKPRPAPSRDKKHSASHDDPPKPHALADKKPVVHKPVIHKPIEGKPAAKRPSIRERLGFKVIEPKTEGVSVKDMLESTVVGRDSSHDQEVIDGLIGSAKHELENNRFDSAKKDIEEAKTIISESGVSPDQKKEMYYKIFELETEIDLNSK